jgi:hypothetical protein
MFFRVIFTNSGKAVTARLIMKSNRLFSSSILLRMAFTFVRFSSSATDETTFIFFSIESRRKNSASGKMIASGMPGKPPPVPASRTLLHSAK